MPHRGEVQRNDFGLVMFLCQTPTPLWDTAWRCITKPFRSLGFRMGESHRLSWARPRTALPPGAAGVLWSVECQQRPRCWDWPCGKFRSAEATQVAGCRKPMGGCTRLDFRPERQVTIGISASGFIRCGLNQLPQAAYHLDHHDS